MWENGSAANSDISIHSLRVEGDDNGRLFAADEVISIHSLRVEGDGRALSAC